MSGSTSTNQDTEHRVSAVADAAEALLDLHNQPHRPTSTPSQPSERTLTLHEYIAWKKSGITRYSEYVVWKEEQMDVDVESTEQGAEKEKKVRKWEEGAEEIIKENAEEKEKAVKGRRNGWWGSPRV